ncbi:Polycystic kidney disease protein 1-like 2-like 4, partial [Homarus americanus]
RPASLMLGCVRCAPLQVRVIERITMDNISIEYMSATDAPEWSPSVFKADTMLNFTAIVKTGNATSFELVVDGEVMASSDSSISYSFQSAGKFNVSMAASGEAGTSPPFLVTVEAAQSLKESDIQFLLPEKVVWPTAYTTAVIKITSVDELPNLVTGDIDWGDNTTLTSVDLTENTPARTTGSVTFNVTHVYQEPGEYLVSLRLVNPVSRVTTNITVRVLEHNTLDTNLVVYHTSSDAPAWNTTYFKTNVQLNLTAVVLTGAPDNFTLQVNGETFTSTSPSFVYTFSNAGEYNISIVSSGEAGESSPAVTTVQVARTLTEENVQVMAPDISVWPHAETEVMIVIMAPGELPTHVEVTIMWDDDAADTYLDLQQDTLPGAIGAVSQNVTHNYSQPGVYQITITFSSPVSQINVTKEVRVLVHLSIKTVMVEYQNEVDAPQWNATMFKTDVPLNFTAVVETGIATNYTLYVEDQVIIENEPSIIYTFQSAGEFSVNMTIHGEAGVSPAMILMVTAVQPLLDELVNLTLPDFIVLPPGVATVMIVVTPSEEIPTFIESYNVTWGDGGNTTGSDMLAETQPGAVGSVIRNPTHNYTESGEFLVTLTVFNPVSVVSVSKLMTVLDELAAGAIIVNYQDEADAPLWYSAAFKTGIPLNFTAVVLSGDAGEYVVNMTTSGDAGMSLPVTTTVLVQRPVLDEHLAVIVPEFVVWSLDIANVTITLSSLGELPTNMTLTIGWSDGEADMDLDLTGETAPGALGSVMREVSRNFSQPGDYVIILHAWNSVSRANVTKTLLVLDRLTLGGILVEYGDASDATDTHSEVFKTNVPLNFTALINSGEAEEFTLTVNQEVLVSTTASFVYTFENAGEYQVTMRTSGEAGASNSMVSWVKVARPLGREDAEVEAPKFVVSPPGNINVTFTLTSPEEVPTNVTGLISWGDGKPPEEVTLERDTPAGAKGPISLILRYIYSKPGDYGLNLYMKNPVSRLNLSELVSVVQKLELTDLVITLKEGDESKTRPQSFYYMTDSVNINPGSVKGEVDNYTLSVSGRDDLMQTTPIFTLTFDRESDYEVAVIAEGLAGASNVVSGWVRVRDSLHDLEVEVSDIETRVDLEISFKIQAPVFLGACLTVDLGDGYLVGWKRTDKCEGKEAGEVEWETKPLSESVTFYYEYTTPGKYEAKIRLFSIMAELVENINITVFDTLPCDHLNVWIQKNGTLEAPVNITRASKLWVRSFAEVNCSVPEISMEINWGMTRVNDSMEEDLSAVDTTKGVLFLPVRTLHYGLYRAIVSYNISMTNTRGSDVWVALEAESVIQVGKSDLMVLMVKGGAPRIRRGTLQTLTLTPGHISYDPDYPEIPLISYVWSCRMENEDLPARGVVSDKPNNRNKYEGKNDMGGCWGEGPGWMSLTKPTFTIDIDIFRNPDKTYILQVIASSVDGRQGTTAVEVEVVVGDPPTLVSGCSPPWFCTQIPGAQLVNLAKVIIKSGCEVMPGKEAIGEDGCGKVPLLYSWKVFGVEPSGARTLPLNITGVTIALLDAFWEIYGSIYQLFDVQVTAQRPGETAQGLAVQRLQINKAPEGGSCSAEILTITEEEEEGVQVGVQVETRVGKVVPTLAVTALVDTVVCNCTDWEDPEGFEIPKYSFFALSDKGEKMILAFGSSSVGQVVLPYGNLSLWGAVSDHMGAETHYLIANIDSLLPTKMAFDEYLARNELTKAVGARDQTKEPEQDENASLEKNKNMLGAVDKFSVTNMDEVIQVNNILGAVADPLPKENQGSAVDMLVTLSSAADKEAPLSQQKDFVAGALATTANLMKGVNKSVKKSNSTNSTNEDTFKLMKMTRARRMKRMAVNESFEIYDEEEDVEIAPYEPSEDDQDANEKVGKMLDVVGASQGALLQSSVVGEEPAKIDAGDQVNMAVGFFDAADLEGRVVEVGGAVYVFPGYCAITRQEASCLTNKSITIGVQMAKWKGQVHGYGGGRDQLSEDSATVQLSLVDSMSMPIPVNDSLEDFIMYIPRAQETVSEPTLIEPTVSPLMALSIHNIFVPAPRVGVTVLVRPENDSDVDEWVLAWSSSTLNGSLEFTENLVYFNNLTYHPDTGFYELFLDSEVIDDVTGMYSVGIGRYNVTIPEPQEHPCFEDPPNNTILLSYDTQFNSSYYFSTFTSSCLFFDKELLTWSSDGCKVIGANSTVTMCSCNHLTSFGSGFFIMPNTIDFSYVFANAGFTDNLTIYLVLIISIGLYLIGLIYARIMDKKDVEKVGATPLPDNNPDDHYLYNLMVHTGQLPSAGTKSKVQFLLVGDWDETDVRTLNEDDKRTLLTRGASDHFIMATERPLGPLHYLRIWHDNSGKAKEASWFFAYMVVRDVQTGEEFQFISNQWLAVEEGDGQVDRLVAVAGEQQLKDYSHVFGKTVQKNLADDHLWFSVFLRPPRSRFTRVQRLSSCMALLYLSMLVNAMFYQRALGVGFISNLIVFPPSFCIVFFFRKSRPRKEKSSRLKAALSKQNPSVYGDVEASGGIKTHPSSSSSSSTSTRTTRKKLITPATVNTDKRSVDSHDTKLKRKKKLTLPWWCVIIAWVLCAISIAVAVFFLWAYGIQFGNEKATKWLTALISSIFSSVLFTQPVKIYLMAMLLSWILKKPLDEFEDYDDDEEEFELGSDEELLHSPPSSQGSRKRKRAQVGAGLSEEELAAAKERRKQELAMQELLLEIFVYLIFLTIILSISHGSKDPNTYLMRTNLADTFAHSSSSTCPEFAKINQNNHFWCWAREALVPNLLNTTLYNGEHRPQEIYGGGGYLVELRGTMSKVMWILDTLEAQEWVDEHTKALFVEFAVFNPQVNLFAVTMFVIEFIPGGGVLPKFEFQGLKLLRYHTPGGAYVLAVEILYIIFTFFYTRREYKSLKKLGWSYFKSIWNLFEICVIILSYIAIVFYLLKTSLTYYLLEKFVATKGKKYIRIQPLAFLDDVLSYVIAFQVFIGTLKLLKLLKFNRRIGMLSATLKDAAVDILGFGLFFIVLIFSFVTVFYLNTLTYVKEFSTFIKAAESSFFVINKKFNDIQAASPILGPIFYFTFAFIMYWIVFQLLIAIICHSFAKVSQDISRQPNDYEVVEYIIARLSAYLSALRPNSVQNVNIAPPKPPDVKSQLWHINTSLDRSLSVLDRSLPSKKGKGT